MTDGSSSELVWHRVSCDGGACVEVAATGNAVLVRSSVNQGALPVTLSRGEWETFLAGVKQGAFDAV